MWFAYGAAWIGTIIGVAVGLYFTHSEWCLLVLLLPVLIDICIAVATNQKPKKRGLK